MTRLSTLRLIAGFIATAAIGACYSSPGYTYGVAYGTYEPPVSPVEVVPTSPGFNYVWVGGHYRWASDRYIWTPGSWVIPARGYSVWSPGHWDHDGHGWFWRDGHWR